MITCNLHHGVQCGEGDGILRETSCLIDGRSSTSETYPFT